MYPVSIAVKATIHLEGSDTEKRMANVMLEESVQVLSTFELNQLASLTYCDEPCDQIFELLSSVMSNPMEYSVLSVQKSLVITKHILTYGSEKCVSSACGLKRWVNRLCEFNTVLWAEKQRGVMSFWNTVKGGAVDHGFPVREAAEKLKVLLDDETKVRQLRLDKSDPNSLVPVGDDRVGYVSDEVRLFMLNKRMKEQQNIITKSNLAKSHRGFGSGYTTQNGQTVVGAAHSLDEMLAKAEREKKRYTDDGPSHVRAPKVNTNQQPMIAVLTPEFDLLEVSVPASVPTPVPPVIDFLDFGASTTHETSAAIDTFSQTPAASALLDPFASISSYPPVSQPVASSTGDLLSMMSVSNLNPVPPITQQSIFDLKPVPTSGPPSVHMSIFDVTPASIGSLPPPAHQSIFDLTPPATTVSTSSHQSIFDFSSTIPPTSLQTENQITTVSYSNPLAGVGVPQAQTMSAYPPPSLASSVMASNEDRFSALDVLAGSEVKATPSLTGMETQGRITSVTNAPVTQSTTVTANLGTTSLGGVVDLANIALTGIFGGKPQGLTVPKYGNDVATMMAEAPSNIPPSVPQMENPPPLPFHNMYTASGATPSYAIPGERQLPLDYHSPLADIVLPIIAPSGGIPGISETYGPPPVDNDDDDDGFGFAMGGKSGMGLGEPVGPPPPVPPPLPPGL